MPPLSPKTNIFNACLGWLMAGVFIYFTAGCSSFERVKTAQNTPALRCTGTLTRDTALRDGVWECHKTADRTDRSEHLFSRQSYVLGKKHGWLQLFYSNGGLDTESHWKANVLDGPFRSYFKNGRVQILSNYSAGTLHGRMKEYAESGVLIAALNFDRGKKHGQQTEYSDQGKLESCTHFEQGREVGPCSRGAR